MSRQDGRGHGCNLYFTEKVQVSGLVKKVEMEGGEVPLVLQALGTQSEALRAKVHTADPSLNFTIHRCPVGCSMTESGEIYLHGLTHPAKEDPWMRNLGRTSTCSPKQILKICAVTEPTASQVSQGLKNGWNGLGAKQQGGEEGT